MNRIDALKAFLVVMFRTQAKSYSRGGEGCTCHKVFFSRNTCMRINNYNCNSVYSLHHCWNNKYVPYVQFLKEITSEDERLQIDELFGQIGNDAQYASDCMDMEVYFEKLSTILIG
jgi:hypothetical protein